MLGVECLKQAENLFHFLVGPMPGVQAGTKDLVRYITN